MNLGLVGHETVSLTDGEQVKQWLADGGTADLALLDVMLPKADGFELLDILLDKRIPVIFLTAKGDIESKLRGLTGGAEDYIVKPFEMLEVIARIDKVLKRYGKRENIFHIDDVEVNSASRTVKKNGKELTLTLIEFDLLLLLNKPVGKYSLGMRQRLGIAQAIMENPSLLILDEPFNGLDKHGVLHIRGLIKDLKMEGKTIILSSHNQTDIDELCDTVCEMDAGNMTMVRNDVLSREKR
jgi:CheY-like chemotaxis protein